MTCDRGGFTLVEMLVVVAIAVLLVTAIGGVTAGLMRSTTQNLRLIEQQDAMRYALDAIVGQLRRGTSLTYPGLPPDGSLLEVRDEVGKVAVNIPERSEPFEFGLNGNSVWTRYPSGPICSQIDQLQVGYDQSSGLVTIVMVSRDDIPGVERGLPIILRTSVVLRNAGD